MNSIFDLYLFPRNQLVPSLTHFSHISASSIVDCTQASASHWNTYQPYLFSSRHHPPSINSYLILSSLSSLQHQNSLLFIPPATELWNCLPLHIRISSSLSTLKNTFNQFYLNSISSLVTVHFKLSPCHHLLLIHVSYIFSTNLRISQLVFAIDFISHVFNKVLKEEKKSCFSLNIFFIIFFICLTQVYSFIEMIKNTPKK